MEFEIKDVNDFTPEFRPSSQYNFSVSEVREESLNRSTHCLYFVRKSLQASNQRENVV